MNTKYQRRLLQAALARQGGLCWWCDMPIAEGKATREHLVPRHANGRSNAANIVAACVGCNHNRGPFDTPTFGYVHMRRVTYLRAQGLYAEMPWRNQVGDGRAAEIPNFGYDHDGKERLWAPQYGLLHGPADSSRKQIYNYARRRVGQQLSRMPWEHENAGASPASPTNSMLLFRRNRTPAS